MSCPTIGKANLQQCFVVLEDVSGTLQKPTSASFVLPAGSGSISQTPSYSNSEELSESLNVLEQFQDAVSPGEITIPMLLRLSASAAPQGSALFTALMGSVQNAGTVTGATVASVDASVTSFDVDGITGGDLPPRGVLTIESEKILYTAKAYDSSASKYTLSGCTRGYADTTAAVHSADTAVTLSSRVWLQEVCRPTVSVWMQFDHFVAFMSGCVVSSATFPMSNTGGQSVEFALQGRKMGWCGTGNIASISGTTITLDSGEADGYTVGALIKNKTKSDDNSGAGYTVSAVNPTANTITISTTPSQTWAADDVIVPWVPSTTAIGSPLESRDAKVYVSGVLGRRREGELAISTPTNFTSEIGDGYPGENADGKREITITGGLFFRAEDAKEFGRGYRGYELPVAVTFGDTPGQILSAAMPRVRFNTPTLSSDGEFLTLEQDGYALGDSADREGESSVFLVQE